MGSGATPEDGRRPAQIDPAQRQLAERRLIEALRRAHRREPLRAEIRLDALLGAVREVRPAAARGHRGGGRLLLDDHALAEVVDGMAAAGKLVRRGRWLRLPDHQPGLGPDMRARVDRLLAGLHESGAVPPRVDGIAARLGIPPGVLDQLRATGELVHAAPGIDYPRDSWELLQQRIDRVAGTGPLTVARVRDALRTTRRHAEALLAGRRAERARLRSRRRGG